MKIGIIGCGDRITWVVSLILGFELGVKVTAVADINIEAAKSKLSKNAVNCDEVTFYDDYEEMLDKEELDGVLIGTRCSMHSQIASKVLGKSINLYLEKPVATSFDDLLKLKKAYEQSKSKVVVSFPLRVTAHVQLVKEIIQSGKLGTIEHVQAINNVPYGGVYFHNWYRDENETGGLFLQKATHDIDYINYILETNPVMLCAMKSKQLFKGDKPAGLKCIDCEEYHTCTESPYVLEKFKCDRVHGDMCCYATDTGNEDSGSVLIRYESGMHVSYSQNFFVRQESGKRGARFVGYNGTVEFDWVSDEVKVFMHNISRVDTYKFDSTKLSHGGGDSVLANNFIRVMQGKEESVSPLDAGLLSALMCLKAKESAETNTFQNITWDR